MLSLEKGYSNSIDNWIMMAAPEHYLWVVDIVIANETFTIIQLEGQTYQDFITYMISLEWNWNH